MSYLLDKKIKRKKFSLTVFFIFLFLILFYFRLSIWNRLSSTGLFVFRPVLVAGNKLGEKLGSAKVYFLSKSSLYLENESLKAKLNENELTMSNYNSILADNASLKEILGRKVEKVVMTLATILEKPNQSIYDTLVIDAGAKQGLQVGETVFALGNVPIGRVAIVYDNSSKVILFSNSGEKTQVVISKGIFGEAVGRGGGNFEMIVPKDFVLAKGDEVVLPGIASYILATVATIISDPRDPFVKALLTSPVNIQELKFVEVEN